MTLLAIASMMVDMSNQDPTVSRTARNVRAAMAANMETVSALAIQLGVSRATATKKHSGDTPFTLGDLERLGAWLGYEPAAFPSKKFEIQSNAWAA